MPVPWSIRDDPTRTPGPPGLAGDGDEAARCLQQRVVAWLARERPRPAVGAERAVDEAFVPGAERVRAEAELVGEPRPEALQEDIGPVDEPEQRVTPALVPQREPSERLPAFEERNIVPSPFQNGGPHARPSSPVSGRSTLTTSAPSAARICAQYGPAIDVVTSTTRVPRSGSSPMPGIIARASSGREPTRLCEDDAVSVLAYLPDLVAFFEQFVEWVSSGWSYLVIFSVAALDAFFPDRPERDGGHHRRGARRAPAISASCS